MPLLQEPVRPISSIASDRPHHQELWSFNRKSKAAKQTMVASAGLKAQLEVEYVRLYCERWGKGSGFADMAARVPMVMTWDDHDVFDGWGSHEDRRRTQRAGFDYHLVKPVRVEMVAEILAGA